MEKFNVFINGKKVQAQKGDTVLKVVRENKIEIPTLCFHPDLDVKAVCRICVVEIEGTRDLATACSTVVEPQMKILTDTPKIRKARKINLELIFAQHCEECNDCVLKYNCQLLKLASKYNVGITRFKDRKIGFPQYQFGPSVFFDSSKCIDCHNCIEVCHNQNVNFLELGEGENRVIPSSKDNIDCIYCGQCIVHCPVGALEAAGEFEDVEKPLLDKSKKVVFQIAPSIRSSIGEEFGLDKSSLIGQIAAGIKKLGAYTVFDTSVAADVTTMEEAKEILEKIEKGTTPCLSSCCPAWVKFVEFNRPDLLPHLATTRSPQIILGGLIKTYWAQKEGLDPKDIVVVSVMPCVSKKYEVKRKELEVNNLPPVDHVLTTRELAYLFKKHKIDLKKIKSIKLDNPFGEPSGAGIIYGASGGVLESALRTALKGKIKIDFKKVRGLDSVKKAEIKIGGKIIRVAAVNGMRGAVQIIKELDLNPKAYAAVEIMACPGGCIGGGGQPLPTGPDSRKKRAETLYEIDSKKKLREAHKSPAIEKIYSDFLNTEAKIKSICHTKYSKKQKENATN